MSTWLVCSIYSKNIIHVMTKIEAIMESLAPMRNQAKEAVAEANTLEDLESVRVAWLGKTGHISLQMKQLGAMDPAQRKEAGKELNILKKEVAQLIDSGKAVMENQKQNQQLAEEMVDITLPAREQVKGSIHPISQVIEEIAEIFGSMGFISSHGPEIEDDFHNFTALNIPPEHPARQMHDTFYLKPDANGENPVLRTHTSSVQIRAMQEGNPPFRVLATGRTYRCDSDITHSPMFHQVEGLCIEKGVHMGHLKGALEQFVQQFFGIEDIPLRFRNSFFPFTEPSAEVDIGCSWKNGELKIGKGDKWLEIGGCGMVHPAVLRNVGINPDDYQGFAFGMGIERMAMLKYGITDLRTFFEGDKRWLNHYKFDALDIPSLVKGLV